MSLHVSPPSSLLLIARKTMLSDECYGSAFYIDPCMAIAPNGDVLLLVDFYPECKGLHKRSILDKKKAPYALYNKEMRPTLYDRDGKFYVIDKRVGRISLL